MGEMKDPENDIVKGMDAILDDEDESEDVKEAVREIKGDMEDVLSEAISIEVESSNKAEDTTSLKDDVDSDYEDALVGMGFSAGDVDSSITHFDFFDKVTSKLEDVWKALASTSSKKREKQKDIITAFFREMK